MTKGEMTRQEIIKKAAPVFNQLGFAGTSVQDIMDATGLEKGGIYRHFSGKQDLAAEVYRYALDQALQARLCPSGSVASPLSKLRHMIDLFVERPSPITGGCPLMNLSVEADDTNPQLNRIAAQALKVWKEWIVSASQESIDQGLLAQTANPVAVANQIISSLEGALLIARLERNREALLQAQRTLHLMLTSLEKEGSATESNRIGSEQRLGAAATGIQNPQNHPNLKDPLPQSQVNSNSQSKSSNQHGNRVFRA